MLAIEFLKAAKEKRRRRRKKKNWRSGERLRHFSARNNETTLIMDGTRAKKGREREREREKSVPPVTSRLNFKPPREEMKYIPRFFPLSFLPSAHKLSVFPPCESEPEI